MAKNHSVVQVSPLSRFEEVRAVSDGFRVFQSSFATPCAPMAGGINSGFMPSTGGASAPVYTIPVNATTPTWFYVRLPFGLFEVDTDLSDRQCSQGAHCAAGMGFAINPPASGNTITAFIAKAMAGAGQSLILLCPLLIADCLLSNSQRNDWSRSVRNRRRWFGRRISDWRRRRRRDVRSSQRIGSPDRRWIGCWSDRCLVLLGLILVNLLSFDRSLQDSVC